MAFFDKALQMGKKFGETTATVAKSAALAAKEKSEQAIEIGKLKKDIAVENGKITKLYSDIGKHAYELYCGDGDFEVLEPLFLQVSDSLAKIEELTEKIEEVKAGDEELEEAGEAEADAEADADAAEETEAESCSICPEPADPAEGEDKDGRAEE